ncbi:ArsR/SmtB family transcription factor [Antrihabitans cavernicola]|uniref:ArsR/SmtB family transcription factor n=1 Tax=Antrihabitans cavernicola TaxID=2495913 RepID=UPI001F171A01|nr:helix-turn-helix domain-containing protein [Spelaeibacter cavernicola]
MSEPRGLDARVSELESRVAALEGDAPPAAADETAGAGIVGYQGNVSVGGGPIDWAIRYDAAAALRIPSEQLAEVLAALGSPVRLALVRTLLRGPTSTKELEAAADLSSPGQLYHHLRALTGARVVEPHGRGTYRIAGPKVVPVLVLILAAADIAGELG